MVANAVRTCRRVRGTWNSTSLSGPASQVVDVGVAVPAGSGSVTGAPAERCCDLLPRLVQGRDAVHQVVEREAGAVAECVERGTELGHGVGLLGPGCRRGLEPARAGPGLTGAAPRARPCWGRGDFVVRCPGWA